jgi:hypothetical protein
MVVRLQPHRGPCRTGTFRLPMEQVGVVPLTRNWRVTTRPAIDVEKADQCIPPWEEVPKQDLLGKCYDLAGFPELDF